MSNDVNYQWPDKSGVVWIDRAELVRRAGRKVMDYVYMMRRENGVVTVADLEKRITDAELVHIVVFTKVCEALEDGRWAKRPELISNAAFDRLMTDVRKSAREWWVAHVTVEERDRRAYLQSIMDREPGLVIDLDTSRVLVERDGTPAK